MMNDLFLRACRREPVERTPVWMMRQAGRYLPEYRAVRAASNFLTMCKTPELAAEVTLQPVDIVGVDAAILFSDILVVPEAMGMQLVVEEGKGGPRFPSPLQGEADIEKLSVPDPADRLRYVLDAVRLIRSQLNGRVPLIGFSGSPWTLASYMVEGHGSTNFQAIKELIFNHPAAAHRLLDKLASAVAAYLSAQVEAGAQAVQLFDTWGGILAPDDFAEFSLRWIRTVIERMSRKDVPVIVFCKGCGNAIPAIVDAGADVVGVDWTWDIGTARTQAGGRAAVQGNLDPTVLFSSPETIRSKVRSILERYGSGSGHVFNLGHGILPGTPVEHAQAFVQAVKEFSPAYHEGGGKQQP